VDAFVSLRVKRLDGCTMMYCAQVGVTVDFSHYSCSDGKVFGFSVSPIAGPGDVKNFVYDRQTGNLIQVIDARLSGDPGTCVGGPPTTPDHGVCYKNVTSTVCNGPIADRWPPRPVGVNNFLPQIP
jgi:hypothetical protein